MYEGLYLNDLVMIQFPMTTLNVFGWSFMWSYLTFHRQLDRRNVVIVCFIQEGAQKCVLI